MKRFILFTIMPAFWLSFCDICPAQFSKEGPQVETFYSVIDDSEQPYSLYLPEGFDVNKTYPLVIMLHGAGSNHRLALRRVFGKSNFPGENDTEASRYFPEWEDVQYIVAAPYARGTMGYQGIPEADVMRVIEEIKKNFNIDENRVYLTGLSMGGGGTLYIGLSRPGLFAAIAPVCPAPPGDAYDLMGNALNLPVAIFQGGADGLVRPEGTRQIVSELRDAGTLVEYQEFPGVGHNVWENAYANGNIFKWFDNIKRDPFPQRVRYTTRWYKYNSAYWVLIDKMTPGTLATIDVQFTSENVLQAKTTNLEAFTLELKDHPRLNPAKPLTISVNGQQVVSSPKYNHSFVLRDGKWVAEKYLASSAQKRKGLEGPMAEAIYDRHVYVYGTGGNPSTEELNRRRAEATLAANFSGGMMSSGGGTAVNPRVISDKQIRDSDYASSNLILFGTRETNAVIERFSNQLPMQLNTEASGYGLVYCFPVNGHYVVVSSGIPFWTTPPAPDRSTVPSAAPATPATPAAPVAAPAAPPAAPAATAPAAAAARTGAAAPAVAAPAQPVRTTVNFGSGTGARALIGMKDFLLFKENNSNVIASGYFTGDWKLPEEELKKLEASGVVTITAQK